MYYSIFYNRTTPYYKVRQSIAPKVLKGVSLRTAKYHSGATPRYKSQPSYLRLRTTPYGKVLIILHTPAVLQRTFMGAQPEIMRTPTNLIIVTILMISTCHVGLVGPLSSDLAQWQKAKV